MDIEVDGAFRSSLDALYAHLRACSFGEAFGVGAESYYVVGAWEDFGAPVAMGLAKGELAAGDIRPPHHHAHAERIVVGHASPHAFGVYHAPYLDHIHVLLVLFYGTVGFLNPRGDFYPGITRI